MYATEELTKYMALSERYLNHLISTYYMSGFDCNYSKNDAISIIMRKRFGDDWATKVN